MNRLSMREVAFEMSQTRRLQKCLIKSAPTEIFNRFTRLL